MSFTEDIKKELCKSQITSECCAGAEFLGMLLYSSRFTTDKIRIISSLGDVRKRAQILISALFGHQFCEEENGLYTENAELIKAVFDRYGFQFRDMSVSLNRAVVEEDCCKASFLRGCFLTGGYVTAGKKGYHLELVTPHYNVSRQVSSLLYEMQLEPGTVTRRGNYVLYYKNSEIIENFLFVMGASGGAMDLMLKKVEKSLVNRINRKVNCETANLDKALLASEKQISAIKKLEQSGKLDELSSELKMTAELRKNNPLLSISELAALSDPPISKPGMSGRLRKLIKISEGLDI